MQKRISGTKHTVPFLLRCFHLKNGTVKPYCSVVPYGKNGTVVQKTEHWYENTEQWYKNTLFRFCSVVEKNGTVEQKRISGTKTHCSIFISLFLFEKNGTVVKKHTVPLSLMEKNETV